MGHLGIMEMRCAYAPLTSFLILFSRNQQIRGLATACFTPVVSKGGSSSPLATLISSTRNESLEVFIRRWCSDSSGKLHSSLVCAMTRVSFLKRGAPNTPQRGAFCNRPCVFCIHKKVPWGLTKSLVSPAGPSQRSRGAN